MVKQSAIQKFNTGIVLQTARHPLPEESVNGPVGLKIVKLYEES